MDNKTYTNSNKMYTQVPKEILITELYLRLRTCSGCINAKTKNKLKP